MLNSCFPSVKKIRKMSFESSFSPTEQFLDDLPFPEVMNYCSSRAHMLPCGERNLRAEGHYIILNNISIDINIDIHVFCAQLYNAVVPAPMEKADKNKYFLSSEKCGCQTNQSCEKTSRL